MKIRDKLLACAMALVVPLCSWAQTETEPNDGYTTSTPVAYNTSMAGSTGACSPTNNTVDYFSFTPPAQGTMRIRTAMSNTGGTDLDVTFRVRQSSTSVLATYVATAGANNSVVNNTFLFTCQGTGLYYISIENPSGPVCTNYSFKYDMIAPEFANDAEPNASYTQADTALAGVDHDGHLNFYYDDNDDYYRIVLPSDGILNIDWQAEQTSASTTDSITVNLRQSSTAVLKTWKVAIGANSTPASQTVSMTCRGNEQFYYMDVVSPTACGVSYRFNYNVTPPVFADDLEPNYSYTQADTVLAGVDHDGRLDFYYDDNDDYFRIILPTDGILNINWQAEHASASTTDSITVNLRQSSTAVLKTWKVAIGANSTPVSQTVSMTCRGNEQLYYIDVVSPTACGVSYRFNYNVTPPVFADDLEPNYSYTQADTVLAGVAHDGRLDFYYDDNDDYFRLILPTDGILNINWQVEHASSSNTDSITVNLRQSSTAVLKTWKVAIGANSTPVSQTVSMTCRGNEQLYYIDVVSPTACGVSYRFNYNVTPPVFADDLEPNSSYTQAISMVLDSAAVPGRLDFYYDNSNDYFKIYHAGGPIVLHTQAENAGPAGTMHVIIRAISTSVLETATIPVGGGFRSRMSTPPLPTSPASTTLNLPIRRFAGSRTALTATMMTTTAPATTSIYAPVAPNQGPRATTVMHAPLAM